ncbi:MAG TPA: amidohydrolase [Blastocatellia bacterium]|nr:amidohydrolase [Blastocatellia bacterium]
MNQGKSVNRRKFLHSFGALSLAGIGTAGLKREQSEQSQPPEPSLTYYPELVIVNAKVATLDDQSSIQQAVAVRDGKFFAVGSSAEIGKLAGPATRVIDAQRRTVVPGLIDTHLHCLRAGLRWKYEVRADDFRKLSTLLEAIKARAQKVPPGTWIATLGGWHWSQIAERRMPTREELDAIAPNHPVYVQAGYDVGQLNTAAIKASGITGSTVAPPGPGASFGKDAQGNFNGVITGMATVRFMETKFPKPTFEEKIEGLRLVMHDFNASGLTGLIDAGTALDDYQPVYELWRRGGMTLRVGMQASSGTLDQAMDWIRHFPGSRLGDDMLWMNSLGEVVLSKMADDVAAGDKPISPETREDFKKVVEAAAEHNDTMSLHCTEENYLNTSVDVFEEVNAEIPLTHLRMTLLHAEQITPAIIERMKRLGMGILIQDRQITNSDEMRQQWGSRIADAPIVKTVYESGIPFGGGTDGTIYVPYRPFMSLWWYVSGRNWRGDVVRPTQVLTREQALRVYTRQAAWFSFHENRRGAIIPGFLADLLILGKDYFTVPENEIPFIRPDVTIVGGKVVFES